LKSLKLIFDESKTQEIVGPSGPAVKPPPRKTRKRKPAKGQAENPQKDRHLSGTFGRFPQKGQAWFGFGSGLVPQKGQAWFGFEIWFDVFVRLFGLFGGGMAVPRGPG
jgi:hypothetical protein